MPKIEVSSIGRYSNAPATKFRRSADTRHFELAWVVEGTSTVECHGHTHDLAPNAAVLTLPGVAATYSWDPNRVSRGGYIYFTWDDAPSDGWPLVRHLGDGDIVIAILNHLAWLETTRPSQWEVQARDALVYALLAFRSGASGTSTGSDHQLSEPIERSMDLVRRRWSDGRPFKPPTLQEMAEAAAVTREHLCRLYKSEVGYTPASALRMLRLRYAASLLNRTNLSVGRVATQAGFESQFHFSRVFKLQFGMTPTQFRATDAAEVPVPDRVRRLGLFL